MICSVSGLLLLNSLISLLHFLVIGRPAEKLLAQGAHLPQTTQLSLALPKPQQLPT